LNKHNSQQGVGMVEVLVALIVLAIGVLGFTALQLRAMEATAEATERTVAMNLARDLAERIRINRGALTAYINAINSKAQAQESGCLGSAVSYVPNCDPTKMANYDAKEIVDKATNNGQIIIMDKCLGSTLSCIYVAWGKTEISKDNLSQCIDTSTGTYLSNSKCLVMEAF